MAENLKKLVVISYFIALTTSHSCPNQCYCDSNIINCQNNDLDGLPIDIDYAVMSLDMSFNRLKELELTDFPNLRYLNVSHNQIFNADNFGDVQKLDVLDLSYNKLPRWILTSSIMQNLTFLDLSYNDVRHMPTNVFLNFNSFRAPSLRILRLINCSIAKIETNFINKLKYLTELHLANNPIRILNKTNALSNNLKFLDFSGCNLQYIHPQSFSNLNSLENLILSRNKKLKNVTIHSETLINLDLSDCALESIPTGNLRMVHIISLSLNLIREIEDNSFGNFPNLQVLNLSHNVFTAINELAFVKLYSITTMDLSFNKINSLAKSAFQNNDQLEFVDLSHNYLRTIDYLISRSITYLDVSFCEIYNLQERSVEGIENLKTLKLQRNFISYLPDDFSASSLQNLDVSYCRIKYLTNKTFAKMPYLHNITLSGNELSTIDPNSFPQVSNMELKDNPWRCNCSKLRSMYHWLVITQYDNTHNLLCDSPEKYEGMTWQAACKTEWSSVTIPKDSLWLYSVGVIITMLIVIFAFLIFKRIQKLKAQRLHIAEQARQAEERECLRRMAQMQRELREGEDRNAPDPRELQRPPSYTEALLLPKLDSSHPSLAGSMHSLASPYSASNPDVSKKGRTRRKRRRRKSDSSEGHRSSRVVLDSEHSETENSQPREVMESDF